jgi:hypothetical protein
VGWRNATSLAPVLSGPSSRDKGEAPDGSPKCRIGPQRAGRPRRSERTEDSLYAEMGCEAGGSVDVRIPNSDQQSSPTSPPVGATHGQTLESAAHAAHEFWAHRRVAGEINERAEDRYRRALDAFLRFAAAHDVTAVSGVTGALCAAWVAAPSSAERPGSRARPGQPASAATRRGRLVVLRATLTVWSTKGWIEPGLAPTDVIPKSPPRPPCPPDTGRSPADPGLREGLCR